MKLKRSISLLLLAVYLFATAGTALASLTCKCVAMKARTEHACCCHCLHVADLPAAAGGGDARTLLRQPPFDRNRTLRFLVFRQQRAVYPLHRPRPAACAGRRVLRVPRMFRFLREKVAERRTPFVTGSHRHSPSASALLPYWLKTPFGTGARVRRSANEF